MRNLAVSASCFGLFVSAGAAWAQQRTLPKPPEHPVLKLKDPEQNTVEIQVTVNAHTRNVQTNDGRYGSSYVVHEWDIDSMVVVLPTITTTGNAIGSTGSVRGQLFVDGREMDNSATIIGPYQGQAMYARYEAGPTRADGFRVVHKQDIVCYETVYDENLAKQLPWPDAWPPDADSTFQPQQLISEVRSSYDNEGPVNELLKHWTNGEDPKKIPPADLAKYLTKCVWDHVRLVRGVMSRLPSDEGVVVTQGRNTLESIAATNSGYEVQHADKTALSGEGSENDMPVLLTAVMRAAGLPARLVIGYREESEDEQDLSNSDRYRTWVEFALFDPAANDGKGQLIWIPVDIVELKQSSSRSRNLNRPWKYFGTNDELDTLVPVSHHFHPPTTVRSYTVPALYGWTTEPAPPELASQSFFMNISATAQRGDDNRQQQQPARRGRRGRP